MHQKLVHAITIILCLRHDRLAGGGMFSTRPSVTKLVDTITWKRMNRLWFQLAVHKWSTGRGHETISCWVRKSKVNITRGRRKIWRLVEAWFSTHLGPSRFYSLLLYSIDHLPIIQTEDHDTCFDNNAA